MDFGFDSKIELMSNFFILIAVLSFYNVTVLFLWNNSEILGVKETSVSNF